MPLSLLVGKVGDDEEENKEITATPREEGLASLVGRASSARGGSSTVGASEGYSRAHGRTKQDRRDDRERHTYLC